MNLTSEHELQHIRWTKELCDMNRGLWALCVCMQMMHRQWQSVCVCVCVCVCRCDMEYEHYVPIEVISVYGYKL